MRAALKFLLKRRDTNLYRFSQLTGLHISTLHRIYQNQRRPTEETLLNIVKGFGDLSTDEEAVLWSASRQIPSELAENPSAAHSIHTAISVSFMYKRGQGGTDDEQRGDVATDL
jgi:predicted transcriptional regulator